MRKKKLGQILSRRALEAPLRQIADNAGAEGSVIVEQSAGQLSSTLVTTLLPGNLKT